MSVSAPDIAFARELFSALGEITHRRMMGGATLYCDGAIFACLDSQGRIYLRASGDLARRMAAEGAAQFSYDRKSDGKTLTMGYWTLPSAALDDPDAACDWAGQALSEGG
ncbi:TfoX/Sxy family protein [Roseovarius aquimarinus]|uniref:TfoX/Sxy family protein n=1 Tax=Roseovarius aquimarinus TaxID=1229156 RepID=A0ABW7I3N7_9RHOB